MDKLSALIKLGIFILLIIALFPSFSNKTSDIHTIYFLQCLSFDATGPTCPKRRYPNKQKWRVFPSEGRVISDQLVSYKNCEIFDAKNWRCPGDKEILIMKDGDYQEIPEAGDIKTNMELIKLIANESVRSPQVPRWSWCLFVIYAAIRDEF